MIFSRTSRRLAAHRYLRHACVLVVAGVLVAAGHNAMSPAVPLTDVFGGSAVLTAATEDQLAGLLATHPAKPYRVAPGDSVASIAAAQQRDPSAIVWANSIQDGTQPILGAQLLLPPGRGALMRTLPGGETLSAFAARIGVDMKVILDYNQLSTDVDLPGGTYVQIPQEFAPAEALLASDAVPIQPGIPGVSQNEFGHTTQQFGDGQCTQYVASQRTVTWKGNAGAWFAQASGIRPENSRIPIAGAILVLSNWGDGHVALVKKVNPDGTLVVGEWHFPNLGKYDERKGTLNELAGGFRVEGFIY